MKKEIYQDNIYYYKIVEIENVEFIFLATTDNPLESAIVHLYPCRYNSILQAIKWFHENKENFK